MRRPTGPTERARVVRGSRFVSFLDRADDPEAASAIRARRAEIHPGATHHCWAYRIRIADEVAGAGFDAGEPAGTAGRPILGALEAADVVQTVCVVTRWFGGTKLGTGGLTRAYAEAARAAIAAALEAGRVESVALHARFALTFDYDTTAAVERAANRFGAREEWAEYGERVQRVVGVPAERADAFGAALAEVAGGAVGLERLADRLAGR